MTALFCDGNPTLNAQWSPAATVLTGDFIFARAAKLAAETDHLPLMKLFAETLATIVNGELTQMFSARGVISRENYYKRIYAKTASLIEMTTWAAAMISPVTEEIVQSMRRFGYHLGIAFQIVDDILDFTGTPSEVGKPVGSDLMQGLITLPALYFIERYPNDERVQLILAGKYDESPAAMQDLVQAIRQSPCIHQALEEATQHIHAALDHLQHQPLCAERTALEELALYTVQRRL
ncbi:MAG: polyprenyl synthetase family protein [Anaerolineales bacterium]|nr:polyprenyl synthetase family protein [Anaerolineales bacterium]